MGDVVEVDDGTKANGLLKFIGRGIVGGQEDFFTFDASNFRQQELGLAAAVRASALLM